MRYLKIIVKKLVYLIGNICSDKPITSAGLKTIPARLLFKLPSLVALTKNLIYPIFNNDEEICGWIISDSNEAKYQVGKILATTDQIITAIKLTISNLNKSYSIDDRFLSTLGHLQLEISAVGGDRISIDRVNKIYKYSVLDSNRKIAEGCIDSAYAKTFLDQLAYLYFKDIELLSFGKKVEVYPSKNKIFITFEELESYRSQDVFFESYA